MPRIGERGGRPVNVYEACSYDHIRKSPDEIIAEKSKAPKVIPVRVRDSNFDHLPDPELLNAIHYYVSQKFSNLALQFDETALLAVGYMVDHWVEDLIGRETHLSYTEVQETRTQEIEKRKKATMNQKVKRTKLTTQKH